jgi:zinc/manganese transport system ATP-binding protein
MSLQISNLTAGYDRHPAVHHVSCTFAPGTLTAIIGPNGGGKSTLLKTIMGFIPPMSGKVSFSGKSKIGYLPQLAEMDRSFPISVFDLVQMGLWEKRGLFGGIHTAQRQKVMDALHTVGMESFAARPIAALSSGQFQRVLFARLLVQDAAILLLDEPFSAIDARTTHDLLHIIDNWGKQGKTVIAVLHDMEQVRRHFPQALLLAREALAHGPTADVLSEANLAHARERAGHWHDHAEPCHLPAKGAA